MTAASSPISRGMRPRYHSRLGIIIAKELGDFFLRTTTGWIYLAAAFLVVPAVLAFVRLMLSNVSLGAHAHDPILEDGNMRNVFPRMFGIAGILVPSLMSISPLQVESVSRSTLEPQLITAARRWELVVGRLLVFGLLSLVWATVQAAMLAVLGHVPVLIAWCPFLSYFHPTSRSLVELAIVMTLGACSVFAINNSMTLVAARLQARFLLIGMCLLGLIVWKIPSLWPVAGFIPFMNTIGGIFAVFSQLPYDARVVPVPPPTNILWNNPAFWLIAAIGSLAITAFVTSATVCSLQKGDLMAARVK